MDQLLPHYERELALLRRSIGTFATRYPKIAVRLGISGDHSEDPHIERMLQSFALLAADIGTRLDDNYPEFAEALLGMLYPQYLRAVPACAVAQFDVSDMFEKLTEPSVIARHTQLASKVEDCRFRTVYDVTLAPVRISAARYASATAVPSDVVLRPGTTGLLSITFEVARPDFRIEAVPSPLRIHVNGTREVVGAVMDTMTMRTVAAFVENIERRWSMLPTPPLTPAGFDGVEKLIDEDDGPPALRLLSEYFAFPKKFDFIDVDLAALAHAAGSDQQLTLHLAICGVHPDSWTAQRLKNLSADNLKLFCTPIVNLFRLTSLPVKRNPITDTYPVHSQNTDAAGVEIWSVDAVRTTTGRSGANIIHPFTSLMHGSSAKPAGPYWVLKQHNVASPSGKKETALSLVELDGRPATDTGIEQITADVSCSNGNFPRTMRAGAEDVRLLEVRKHADFFKAAVDEVQVIFPLHSIRIRRQRLVKIVAERAARLRMLVEYIGQNLLAVLLLPVAHIATQPQEIEPGRECQLVIGQRPIESQPAESVNVTVDRHVRAVGLLNPKRDGFAK